MGMGALFQSVAATVPGIFGTDVFKPAEYQPYPSVPGAVTIDAGSGMPVWNDLPALVASVPVMIAAFDSRELVNTAIQATDAQGFIAAAHLPGVTPKPGDVLRVIGETTIWEIIGATTHPATALWVLHLRPYTFWPRDKH